MLTYSVVYSADLLVVYSADLMPLENCRLLFLTELFDIEKPGTQLTERDLMQNPTASPAKRQPLFPQSFFCFFWVRLALVRSVARQMSLVVCSLSLFSSSSAFDWPEADL